MVPTRRRALGGAAALLAALAGCNAPPAAPPPDDTGQDRRDRPERVATDPPTVTVRREGLRDPLVTVAESDGEPTGTARERRRAVERDFVTTAADARLLRVADVDGAHTARRFLADTDFDAEFVYLDRHTVGQCFERLLCHVAWSQTELRLAYAEVYRDYDVDCDADARDRVVRFIRLEGDVDPLQMDSGGTTTHRGGCLPPGWRRENRRDDQTGTTTANDQSGAATTRTTAANDQSGAATTRSSAAGDVRPADPDPDLDGRAP